MYSLRNKSQAMVRQLKHPDSFNYLQVGCWNVRTLVAANGGICTGMSRPGERRLVVDRKVEFLVCELKRF